MILMEITYQTGVTPAAEMIAEVYNSSGINRPTSDIDRIRRMYAHSNLIVTAWNGEALVGIARSLTDYCYSCYLADLAVRQEFQKQGIGKKLVELTKEKIGEQTTLILLAATEAIDYYPKIGMNKIDNGYIIKRTM